MEPEDVVTFYQSDLPCNSFAAFEDMRTRGELCDLTIKVQNNSLRAHRVILAAVIPYFRSIFTKGEIDAKGAEISVGNLDPKVLESLIDFAYSSRINITTQNVQSLLQASKFLQLDQVLEASVEFLSKRLRVNGISEIYTLAHDLGNMNLIERSKHYILENFEEFSKSEDFLALPHSCVKEIISDDDLNVSSEEVLFESVISWVKVSPLERHEVLPELLHEVRMIHLPTDYLVLQVESEELIRISIPCRDLVNEVKNYHLVKNKFVVPNLKTAPRNRDKPGIYTVCYDNRIKECSVYCSDYTNDTWQKISSVVLKNVSCYVYHAVTVNDKLFIFFSESIATFHLILLEWKELDTRHEAIDFSSILSHGNVIYCFGSTDKNFSDKVRRFDTIRNVWLTPRAMKTARWGSAAAALENYIFVTGGHARINYLTTVEKYDHSADEWTDAAPMLTPRSSHGCVTIKGKIYAFGGYSEDGHCCTAEMYDPLTDQWKFISSMATKRNLFSSFAYRGQIYAHGGLTGDGSCVKEVEIYDPDINQWKVAILLPKDVDNDSGLNVRAVLATISHN